MPSLISLNGPYSTLFSGDKPDTRIDITEITSQHYKVESRSWDGKELGFLKKEEQFKHRTDSVNQAQKKISDFRWTTEIYLTGALLAGWVFDRWYFGEDHTLTIQGRSFSTTNLALSTWVASIILTRTTAELFNWKVSLRDPLTALQQKLKFSKFQETVSGCAAIAFVVATVIGICLLNRASATRRLESLMDFKTAFFLTMGSLSASFCAIKYLDRQKEKTERRAQELARWVITQMNLPNVLVVPPPAEKDKIPNP